MHRREVTGASEVRERIARAGLGEAGHSNVGYRAARRALLVSTLAALTLHVEADDWPMLGGRPDRNMVSGERGLPTAWDERTNVKWTADLGKVTFGAPVISGGRVFIGTDNDDPGSNAKRGVLKCFAEADGKLLWRAVHEKLPSPSEDETSIGICSTPCVAGEHVYYVSNRAELLCRSVRDGAVVWQLDFRARLGVTPNQASASSPLVVGDRVYVVTGQGADNKTGVVKRPEAPSFLAVNRLTGEIAWQDNSPGAKIITGQWGSPGYGTVAGQPQVAFPGGDGWLYSFDPVSGKLRWKFNCKAHEKPGADGAPETTFNLVAAPVFAGDRVFIAIGEPEASSGPGALRCLDASLEGDVTARAERWRIGGKEFNDSISTVAVDGGLVYAADTAGFLHCLDAKTGERLWQHDLLSNVWGSPLVADGKVYVQVGEGTVYIFTTGRMKKLLAKNESLPDMAHGTPVAANGVLYLTGQKKLYAIAAK